jgi:ABC-type polar amino acid transport system ATPase subunit
MVTVNNITIRIKNKIVLNSISCSLTPGHITVFIGKSGAGKSTLLKSVMGLTPITDGTITINEKQIKELTAQQRAQEIGCVFQEFNLFPHLTVLENCSNPLLVHGTEKNKAEKQARDVLQKLDMQDFITKYPGELSGGQMQRVAIARALCLKPKIILLDEPTASLDPVNTDILVNILKKLAAQGLTVGLSTQDMNFVRKVFDRMYYIEEGKIVEFCDTTQNLTTCPIIQQFMKN